MPNPTKLRNYLPNLGKQRGYTLAKASYAGLSVMGHVLRGTEPDISAYPAAHAAESQNLFLRDILHATEEEFPSRQFTMGGTPHPNNLAVESAHLGIQYGGCAWTNTVAIRDIAFASKILDTIGLLRNMPTVSRHIPHPKEWEHGPDPSLRATIKCIQ